MSYKLFATDLDGTLLDRTGRVHATDREAISQLQARGIPVTICTGRLFTGTRHIAEEVGVEGGIVCTDGTDVMHAQTGEALLRHPMDLDALCSVQSVFEGSESAYAMARDAIYHDDRGLDLLSYMSIWSKDHNRIDNIHRFSELDVAQEVSALVGLGHEEWAAEAQTAVRERSSGRLQVAAFATRRPEFRGLWAVFARTAGPTKATGLKWLADQQGIGLEDVVFVGDWHNDIPLLREAGATFAMSQAPTEVRDAAQHVLKADSTTGGGIAEAAKIAGLLEP